jgi:predicted Zn finger-like uncharacterized protein
MAIQTSCPHCQQTYELADTQIGKKVRCKSCSEAFLVRDRDAERKAAARSRDDDFDEPRAPRRKKQGMPTGLLIAGGISVFVLLLGCLGGGGALLWIYGPFANRITKENFDKIQNGMTENEVKAILGEPNADEINQNLNRGGFRVNSFGVSGLAWKRGNNAIAVSFINGRVVAKSAHFGDLKR